MAPVIDKGTWLTAKVGVRIHIDYLWYTRPYGGRTAGVTLVQRASSHMAASIWQQVHRVTNPRRQVHGSKYMAASTWRQVYGGKYMAASISCGSKYMAASTWRQVYQVAASTWQQVYGGKYMAASISCGSKYMAASIWQQVYGGKYMAASISCGSKYMAASTWQQVWHVAARMWRPVCHVAASIWRQAYGGKITGPQSADTGRKLSRPQHGGKYMAASIPYGSKYIMW